MLIIACISSHGFGHGVRMATLLRELLRRRHDIELVLSTGLPEDLLRQNLGDLPWLHRPCIWDVGVRQADALGSDPAATLTALAALEASLPRQLEQEVAWLAPRLAAHGGRGLVIADIPPAAVRLAESLGIPLVWHGNFGWDAIYAALGPAFVPWVEHCQRLYRRGQALIRCPFPLTMDWGLPQLSIGGESGTPRLGTEELRRRLGHDHPRERTALLSFGGMGLALDPALPSRWPDWRFLVCDRRLPEAANLIPVPADLRPLDVLPLCQLVITKPGYSTFCEALAQDVGVVAVERAQFAEAAVLLEGLQRHGRHRILSRDQFGSGEWALDRPLAPPMGPPLASDGADRAAAWLATHWCPLP
jgi:hypothetical protein